MSPQNNLARRVGCPTTKPAPARQANFLPICLPERKSRKSYIPHILAFLLVLWPLLIPIGVSVVHAVRTRRLRLAVLALPPPGNLGALDRPSNSIGGLQD